MLLYLRNKFSFVKKKLKCSPRRGEIINIYKIRAVQRSLQVTEGCVRSVPCKLCLSFGWVLCRTNTVKISWRLSNFPCGGRPQVPLRALFYERAAPEQNHRRSVSLLDSFPRVKDFKVLGGIRIHSDEGHVILSQRI